MKLLLRVVFVIILAAVLSAGVLGGMAYLNNKAPADIVEEPSVFTVNKGESVQTVARRLKKSNLIRGEMLLRIMAKVRRTETSIQAGSYKIEPGATVTQIHEILVSGAEILHKITIPEGWTSSRIGILLDKAGITDKDQFMGAVIDRDLLDSLGIHKESAEGFLYPDTYFMPADYPAERVVEHLVRRFFKVLAEIIDGTMTYTFPELNEKVIIASIIEREYVVPKEAPLMASVFYNRLAIDMKLQSCATVAYVLTEEVGADHPDSLTLRDLEVQSAYNTYIHAGIPPGPIGNPGKTAIEAALFPAETDFLFFVLKSQSTGEHEFTQNYDQHLDAKSLFLKKS